VGARDHTGTRIRRWLTDTPMPPRHILVVMDSCRERGGSGIARVTVCRPRGRVAGPDGAPVPIFMNAGAGES